MLDGRRRTIVRRPLARVAALAARFAGVRAYALWPDGEHPMRGVDLRSRAGAEWLRATFDRDLPAPAGRFASRAWRTLDARTLAALRAGAVSFGPPPALTTMAAERALGHPMRHASVAMHSASGSPTSKVTYFVFERGEAEPSLAVRTMPRAQDGPRLRLEIEAVEKVRGRCRHAPRVAAALPTPPLYAGEIEGRYVAVLALDPLASATGHADRETALGWLTELQERTGEEPMPWTPHETEREVAEVVRAWDWARSEKTRNVREHTVDLFAQLEGATISRCIVHGDYWRGNIAQRDSDIRVFDWEWARESGHPFHDLWLYEIGEIRLRSETDPIVLTGLVRDGVARIETHLVARGLDARFAPAMLVPTLARLVNRSRPNLDSPDDPLFGLMRTVERVLEA